MVDGFFQKLKDAKDAIVGQDREQVDPDGNYEDPSAEPYGDQAEDAGTDYGQFGNVSPASEDPYGDPADDVADAGQFGNVSPASEDPYGDPADEEGFS